MPVYEYKCKSCGREFELEQRITEEAIKDCPFEDCNGEVFRKISKNVGLVFKGNGFYLTDYAKKHESAAASHSNGHNGNGSTKKEDVTAKVPANGESTSSKISETTKVS
jgi:putative FmdB family regulatory protein